jgi:hypothetical protein
MLKMKIESILCFQTKSFPSQFGVYTGYFPSDNEPGEIENATHNTFPKLTWLF